MDIIALWSLYSSMSEAYKMSILYVVWIQY